jgi:hypothetical protein
MKKKEERERERERERANKRCFVFITSVEEAKMNLYHGNKYGIMIILPKLHTLH